VPGKPHALVLAPTRELAVQIAESIAVYGRHASVRTAVIYGGVGQNAQVNALRAGVDNVFADRLSRDMSLQELHAPPSPVPLSGTKVSHRLTTARRILMTLSDWPSTIPLQKILEIVDLLE
jgi:hypothetical protein